MEPKIKDALVELQLSLIKGIKVLVVYILPSVLVALLLSSEFRTYVEEKPELVAYAPMINVVVIAFASLVKRHTPEDSNINKIL